MKHITAMKLSVISFLCAMSICVGAFGQIKTIDKVVGVIGEEVILYSEVQGQILELIQNKIDIKPETECILFENFLYNALLLHQAKVDSLDPNIEQIDNELNSKMDYYRNLLKQYGQTFESAYNKSELEWREEIREMMIKRNRIEQMQAKITEGVTITPREVRAYFENIPKDSLPRINSSVEYGEIIIYPELSETVEQKEIDRLNKWREQIVSGQEDFDFIAELYSHDESSAKNGGSFDCVSKGMFVPEFDAVALSLKPGEISKPFKTQFGWHIVMVEDRRGSTYCGKHILRIPRITPEKLKEARDSVKTIIDKINTGAFDFCGAAKAFSQDENSKFMCGKVVNQRNASTVWDVGDLSADVGAILDRLEPGEMSAPFVYETNIGRQAYKFVILFNRTKPPHCQFG